MFWIFLFLATNAYGQKVVFLTGDDEYRSEESMPMIARTLERDYGFETRVGFSLDEDGTVNPRSAKSLRTALELNAIAEVVKTFGNTVAPKLSTSSATTVINTGT